MSGTLFFDGQCGMCTRSRNLLAEAEPDRRSAKRSRCRARARRERLGIPRVAAARIGAWLDSSGDVYAGAEAANAAVSAALGTRLPLLIYRIPGLRSLQDAVYRWVADHRYRFPGTTPYCESHPVAC